MLHGVVNEGTSRILVEVFNLESQFVLIRPVIITFHEGNIFPAALFERLHCVSTRAYILFAQQKLYFVRITTLVIFDDFDGAIGGAIVAH
jgi:hypothetical protein